MSDGRKKFFVDCAAFFPEFPAFTLTIHTLVAMPSYFFGMITAKTPIPLERPLATGKPWIVCGISRAQWFKLFASGRTPLPTARLGARRPVFLIAELEAWLQAGAPDRVTWQTVRNQHVAGM